MRESMECSVGVGGDPLLQIDEHAARDAVGMEAYVFIEVISRLLYGAMRDLVGRQPVVTKEEIRRVANGGSRDEIGESGPSP